jgi:hypothetical protein
MEIAETLQRYEKIVSLLDQKAEIQDRIAVKTRQLKFALLYQEGLWKADTFWLAGIPKKKLGEELAEYVKSCKGAFGKPPSWFVGTSCSRALDLDSFYGQMKLRWKKGHLTN